MQRIYYMGGVAELGDRTGDALLSYGRALANRGIADVVEVLVRAADGTVRTARFLLGPASMLLATGIDGSSAGLADDETAAELESRTARLLPVTSAWSGGGDDGPSGPPFDDFF